MAANPASSRTTTAVYFTVIVTIYEHLIAIIGSVVILFFCGAPKHASHFQLFIVTEALRQMGHAYQQVGNTIFHQRDLKKSKQLLDEICFDKKTFICKGHYGSKKERDFLLGYENIRICLIWRDIRDVLVSQYFYEINKGGKDYKDFAEFYRTKGRWFACYHAVYKRNWDAVNDDPRIVNTDFDGLKNDFHHTATRFLSRLGIHDVDLAALESELSLERLRKKHNDAKGAFFRKGRIGDHREVIADEQIYADLARIADMKAAALAIQLQTTKIPVAFAKIRGMIRSGKP